MILVTVGEHYAPYLLLVFFEICEIGDNKVYTEHIIIGERKSAVNDEYIVAAFVNVNVLAYLVYAAERHNSYRCLSAFLLIVLGKIRRILHILMLFVFIAVRLVIRKHGFFVSLPVIGKHRLLFALSVVSQYRFLFALSVVGKHGLLFTLSVVGQYRFLTALSVIGKNRLSVIKHRTSFVGKHLSACRYRLGAFQHIGFLIFRRISVGQLELLCKRIFLALRIRLGRLGLYAFRYSQ